MVVEAEDELAASVVEDCKLETISYNTSQQDTKNKLDSIIQLKLT